VLSGRSLVGQPVAPQHAAVDIDVADAANAQHFIMGRRVGDDAEDGRRRHLNRHVASEFQAGHRIDAIDSGRNHHGAASARQ